MKKSISVLAFTLFLNSFLAAQSSFDYAYGLELNAQSGQIFSRVEIPDEVYLNTLSPLLKDATVFNANDQAVAFSFVDVEKIENITQ
ncbi:MAG: DUF3999 domain-containing protein [Campylobacteraceae bacterium]|jgi:hypothetical protein|nr:DUF3999 domain-containing protein [Campylobacteraceae bacterium]